MYAVFKIDGFQYSAQEGDVLRVPRQKADPGVSVKIDQVLLVKNGDQTMIGTPIVADASIDAEVLSGGLSEKVLIYKYKRRTKYRRTQGHRQSYSEIKINKIHAPGV